MLSTPAGKRGVFWNEWSEGVNVVRVEVTADECLRIHPAFLAKMKAKLAPWEYEQEFLCRFVDTDEAVFTSVLLEKMFANQERALWT